MADPGLSRDHAVISEIYNDRGEKPGHFRADCLPGSNDTNGQHAHEKAVLDRRRAAIFMHQLSKNSARSNDHAGAPLATAFQRAAYDRKLDLISIKLKVNCESSLRPLRRFRKFVAPLKRAPPWDGAQRIVCAAFAAPAQTTRAGGKRPSHLALRDRQNGQQFSRRAVPTPRISFPLHSTRG
jgi:hypothetical protein